MSLKSRVEIRTLSCLAVQSGPNILETSEFNLDIIMTDNIVKIEAHYVQDVLWFTVGASSGIVEGLLRTLDGGTVKNSFCQFSEGNLFI